LNHYISEELKGKPPMIVYIKKWSSVMDAFDAPSGFDLKKYASRYSHDSLMKLSDQWQSEGEIRVDTYGSRSYTGVYKKIYKEQD
jgi:hypothetical protein